MVPGMVMLSDLNVNDKFYQFCAICLECVRVKMEVKTIECGAFFYNEGAKGDDYIQKNKFRCRVVSGEVR